MGKRSSREPSLAQRFVEARRAEIVVLVVLPISLFISIKRSLKDRFFGPSPKDHEDRVDAVVEAVKRYREARQQHQQQQQQQKSDGGDGDDAKPRLLRTDRSPYQSHSVRNDPKRNAIQIPMRSLECILSLDVDGDGGGETNRGTVHVEPGSTVGAVTTFLLEKGWMLECCLEMEDATLGGLVLAQGMTTHSHVCGLVSETVTEYNLVTANGDRLRLKENGEHGDLFRAMPMSHGTLGLLVSLRLRVVRSRPWVRLSYTPLYSAADLHRRYTSVLDGASREDPATPFFVESIAFGRETSVLMTGTLSTTNRDDDDDKDSNALTNRIGWWWKPWFFKHVESKLELRTTTAEYIPIREYLMRHDRSMCTTMATVIPYGNHPVFRWLLGWLLPPQMSFLKSSHTSETREASLRKQCYQDVCFPADRLPTLLDFVEREFGIYPLLVYPCMHRNDRKAFLKILPPSTTDSNSDSNKSYYLNLGIYGVPPALPKYHETAGGGGGGAIYPMITKVRKLEALLRDVRGFQHTYCDSFQSEAEFSDMFDTEGLYRTMRAEHGCEGVFPTVYDKTRPEVDLWTWLKEEGKRE